MSKLSYEEKKELPKKEFVIKKKKGEMKGSYPIEDKAHARNALARVSQFGSSFFSSYDSLDIISFY